jgi:peptidoglycan hydrolase CwlO-like protein
MEPQVRKIFSKLPKTELSTEKVELNVMQDIDKTLDKLVSEFQSLRVLEGDIDVQLQNVKSAKDKLDDIIRDAKQGQKETQKKISEVNKLKEKAEKAARDLGVDAKEIKGFNQIDDITSDAEEEIKNISLMIKQAS